MGNGPFSNYTVDYRLEKDNEKEKTSSEKRQTIKVIATPRTVFKYSGTNPSENKLKTKVGNKKSKNKIKKAGVIQKNKILIYKILMSTLFLLMAFFVVIVLINKFSSLKDEVTPTVNTVDNKYEINYSEFLAPIVMHDPDPFISPEKADKQMKISSSIWRCVMKNGVNKYQDYDERGLTLIPVADIENSCTELFGEKNGINFNEQIFGPFYSSNEDEKFFHICAISNQESYLPYIENIKRGNDTVVLKVSYVTREDPFFKENVEKPKEPVAKKQMIYTLKVNENSKNYFLHSVEKCE